MTHSKYRTPGIFQSLVVCAAIFGVVMTAGLSASIAKTVEAVGFVGVAQNASSPADAPSAVDAAGTAGQVIFMAESGADDPWKKLQEQFGKESPGASPSGRQSMPESPRKEKREAEAEAEDPWAKLRAIYLPFTEEEETAAVTDTAVRQKVSKGLHAAVDPYARLIEEASGLFNIPPEIISAVIMVESGGNARAKARTSSASGLMQTISATFSDARNALDAKGISITASPFDPKSSIMAGSWYLDRMYERARADRPGAVGPRSQMDSWKYPLEYYYAGPGHGVKREPVVIIYSGGRKVVVDKPAYSGKVLKWARIMEQNKT